FGVERIAQRIDDAADDGVTDRHAEQVAGASDLVAFDDFQVLAEDDDADRILFEVEGESANPRARELDHLAGHDAGQAVDASDAVADFEHAAHLAGLEMGAILVDLTLEN